MLLQKPHKDYLVDDNDTRGCTNQNEVAQKVLNNLTVKSNEVSEYFWEFSLSRGCVKPIKMKISQSLNID